MSFCRCLSFLEDIALYPSGNMVMALCTRCGSRFSDGTHPLLGVTLYDAAYQHRTYECRPRPTPTQGTLHVGADDPGH